MPVYLMELKRTQRLIVEAANKEEAQHLFWLRRKNGNDHTGLVSGPSDVHYETVVTRLSKRDGSRWQKFMDLITGRISLDEIDGDSFNVAFERDK